MKTAIAKITLSDTGSDTVELWVGTGTGSAVDVSGTAAATLSMELSSVNAFRFNGGSNQQFDNLVVGTTNLDIAATAPTATWTNTAGGTWGTAVGAGSNWLNAVVGGGSGNTANFNTLNITADTTVNLDSARTIGNLIFGDTDTSTAAGWTLANNATPANILTLAGGTPTITVNALGTAKTATISAVVAGTQGLTKAGTGTLTLTGNNTYTGGTTINEGTVIAGAGGVAMGAVTIASGATLATTSAASTGLAALYYNNGSINQADIASLPALLNHFGANSPAPSLVQTATSMNFAGDGSGFPSPYNSGAANFEAFYSGKVNIGTGGTYTFNTSSDDGSMLFINGQAVVTNNFGQAYTGSTKTGTISLSAGMHDIVIAYNQGGGGYGMNAQMSGADNTTMVDISTTNAHITPDLVVGSLAGAGNVELSTGNLITGIDNSSTNFSGVISGSSSSLTKFGTGTQTLAGTNTYTGATKIIAGTLQLGDGGTTGSLSTSSAITNNGNFTINRSDAVVQGTDFSGSAITGTGSLTKAGAGTLTLSAANTYTGATTINGGTLRLGSSYATEGLIGRWTFDGGNAADSSGNNYNGTAVGSPTYSAADTHGGAGNALVLNGASAIRVDTGGDQTVFDGGSAMTVSAWVQGVPGQWNPFVGKNGETNGWQLRRHAEANTLDWTTRGLSSSDYESNATNALDGGWHMVTMTYDGSTKSIYVDGILNASTAATGTIAASLSQLMFGGRDNGGFGNFLTGKLDDIYFYNRSITATEVTALYNDSILPSTTPVTIASGATFDLNGNSQKIASLTGDIGATVTNEGIGDSGLTISGTAITTFNGIISNGATNKISLVKSGSGTQILTGANTYTGATTVSQGTLLINGNQSGATGAVTVASGATLGGNGIIGGTLEVTGILAPGDGGIESLDVTNNVTWKGAASAAAETIWQFELGASNTADLLNITGDFTKDASAGSVFRFDFMNSNYNGTFKLVDWSNSTNFLIGDFSYTNLGGGRTGSFTFNGSSLEFTAVPEPTSALAGLLIAAGLLRRRR